jgi:calcium-dependent protein kinase
MTRQFRKLDLDGTGLIHAHEIKQYITENNVIISDREVEELIREIDYAGNGKINYSEFLAATIDCKQFFDDQKFRVVFSMFDLEGNNQITAREMHLAFQKLGQNVPIEEVQKLIKAHDLE